MSPSENVAEFEPNSYHNLKLYKNFGFSFTRTQTSYRRPNSRWVTVSVNCTDNDANEDKIPTVHSKTCPLSSAPPNKAVNHQPDRVLT